MKKIKFLSIIFFQVLLVQFAVGQSSASQATDEYGRPLGTTPNPVPETQDEKPADHDAELKNGSDFDVPGQYNRDDTEYVFPQDFTNLMDEMYASATPQEVARRINRLEEQVSELMRMNEQLQQENRTLFRSLSNCCSASGMNLTASDAYLLQNAPNTFDRTSEINYFIPTEVRDARIEVRDVKGELLETHRIEGGGFGKLDIDAANLLSGTFIYSLHIGTDMVDSKVMIITK